ncbi:MAG: hypothetical protein OXI80_07940 [Caldilineaceae bacterium]|nr:hypothetical protein [Caldilineaceae bacterium]MDE0337587.1 hypothetical protein [Caldilineaceae bacterium]
MRERSALYAWPDLRATLKGIRWAVVGAVATRAYMPERMTCGFDILVHHHDGDAALARLNDAGFEVASELSIPGFMLNAPDGTEIDLLLIPFEWLDEALQPDQTDAAGYPVLGLPYLVLMKMETSRPQDLGDLSRMLGLADEDDLTQVRAAVIRHMPDAAEDLESLIYLGRLEMGGV